MPEIDPLPPEARERFPDFRADDPSTWPEPDKCTEGRPWGLGAYSDANGLRSWDSYLRGSDRQRCRNRARYDGLCGTHYNVRHDRLSREARERAAREDGERALDLARRLAPHLAPHGIALDATGRNLHLDLRSADRLADVLDALARRLGEPTIPTDLLED